MLELVRSHGLEGVVAKRLSSSYEQGRRTGAWTKMRVELAQELVIGGYTPGTHGFDAVLVGFYRGDRLHFCASVRAGFVPTSRRAVHAQLAPLQAKDCPFVNLPAAAGRWGQGLTAAKMKNCVWLRPEAVAPVPIWNGPPTTIVVTCAVYRLEDRERLAVVDKQQPGGTQCIQNEH